MTVTWATNRAHTTRVGTGRERRHPDAVNDAMRAERQWRLLPGVTDRQLVVVVGFIAVIAYLAIGLVSFALLLRTPLGHTWPVIVAAAGLGAGVVTGLLGLLVCGLRFLARGQGKTHS